MRECCEQWGALSTRGGRGIRCTLAPPLEAGNERKGNGTQAKALPIPAHAIVIADPDLFVDHLTHHLPVDQDIVDQRRLRQRIRSLGQRGDSSYVVTRTLSRPSGISTGLPGSVSVKTYIFCRVPQRTIPSKVST